MFMKKLTQKNLAKALVGSLVVSGGLLVGMGQAQATTYISGVEYRHEAPVYFGTNMTISQNKGGQEFEYDGRIEGINGGTNNTLNIDGRIDAFVHNISNIQTLNFYIDKWEYMDQFPMVVADAVDWHNVKNVNAYIKKGNKYAVGDRICILFAGYWNGIDEETITTFQAAASDFEDYELEIKREGDLYVTVKGIKKNTENNDKSPAETQAAGLTMLTTAADMLASQGFDRAAAAIAGEVKAGGSANTLTPFVTMGGAKTKVKTGSHVDVKGWNLNAGFAKEIQNKAGKLLIGPVVEYGKGSYDSYLDNGFHGEGDTHYIGGGVMAKQTNNNGLYYEGSLRAGKLSNDYKSQGFSSNSFDSDSTYYAAHVGLGKIIKLSEKNTLDYYGKYFYTHQRGNDATMHTGDLDINMHFDSMNSNRTRIGGRLTHAMNEKNSIYAGLAWQHEFSGTARATMNGSGAPAPSLKGNTGLMELGWKVEAGRKVELDLNATGYTGKQKGASLNLAVNYKF